MPITSNILKKYLNPVFIETGSGLGYGIQAAIDAGFKLIYSTDTSLQSYEHCYNRFFKILHKNLELIHSKSTVWMEMLLNDLNRECTFWLDAHNENDYPVLSELDEIAKNSIKTHTILIDDLRMFPTDKNGLTIEQIKAKILSINPDYEFSYENGHIENDILVAKIK
jgi:hypothetical protein